MSVIEYKGEDVGALANVVLMNEEYKSAITSIKDHYEELVFKKDQKAIDNTVICFFDRLYIANQLAAAITYPSKDGIMTIHRLQVEDIKGLKFASTHLNGPRALNSALRSMSYNIISNGGRSFFDEEDSQKLDNLISLTANMVLDATEKRA